jgi:hypothetical protein
MNRLCVIAVMVAAGWTVNPGRALACADLQPSIQVDDFFKSVVVNVLAASPTFSRQCERIAALPMVRVSILALPQEEQSCCRARTTIRRYSSGALIAWVEIPSLGTALEYAELLGHEFEHILEQIDLVDLEAQADQGAGAKRVEDGAYETDRAQRAGEAVAKEAAITRTTPTTPYPPR